MTVWRVNYLFSTFPCFLFCFCFCLFVLSLFPLFFISFRQKCFRTKWRDRNFWLDFRYFQTETKLLLFQTAMDLRSFKLILFAFKRSIFDLYSITHVTCASRTKLKIGQGYFLLKPLMLKRTVLFCHAKFYIKPQRTGNKLGRWPGAEWRINLNSFELTNIDRA